MIMYMDICIQILHANITYTLFGAGISYDGFDNRPLIDGNFDRATFGVDRGNTNSTACLA